MASRSGSEGHVTGLDLGEGMLARARTWPPVEGDAPIDYVQGSADELPFADGSFTVVTCQQGLQFFPDRDAALREFRRVLAPGTHSARRPQRLAARLLNRRTSDSGKRTDNIFKCWLACMTTF